MMSKKRQSSLMELIEPIGNKPAKPSNGTFIEQIKHSIAMLEYRIAHEDITKQGEMNKAKASSGYGSARSEAYEVPDASELNIKQINADRKFLRSLQFKPTEVYEIAHSKNPRFSRNPTGLNLARLMNFCNIFVRFKKVGEFENLLTPTIS